MCITRSRRWWGDFGDDFSTIFGDKKVKNCTKYHRSYDLFNPLQWHKIQPYKTVKDWRLRHNIKNWVHHWIIHMVSASGFHRQNWLFPTWWKGLGQKHKGKQKSHNLSPLWSSSFHRFKRPKSKTIIIVSRDKNNKHINTIIWWSFRIPRSSTVVFLHKSQAPPLLME